MPMLFTDFCTLLQDLESFGTRHPPLPQARREELNRHATAQWFRKHNVVIDSTDVNAVVILSSVFPARRTDRVYNIQPPSLSRLLRRCLSLGLGRWQQLEQWKIPGRGDLGDCVERVQREAENAVPFNPVTLEEVDETLENIAKACRFSAPSVRAGLIGHDLDKAEVLRSIYLRLQSRESKWFTRMILKDYGCLDLNEGMVLNCLDSRLPAMVKAQDSFESAVNSLRGVQMHGPPVEGKPVQEAKSKSTGPVPRIGTKVGRAVYLKGRSINQAVQMIDGRTMSVERKYDGEYCQVHIDLSKGEQCIQIFSKTGKDSTQDKRGLHKPIKDSLRLGQADCGFSKHCIVEGEMVVWSDKHNCIAGFHKIRKHVNRSGSFLGTALDSQPHHFEHLMIFYYDLMLLDDDPILNQPHWRRRRHLEQLITPIKGRAKLATREEYLFKSSNGPKKLQRALAHAFAHQWEGLVLKPSHEPYFRTVGRRTGRFASCWIKIKKDYIPGLGDTADFAIVGATYNSSEAARIGKTTLSWNRFHVGCLTNKDAVLSLGAKPHFAVVDSLNACIKPDDLITINRLGQFRAVSTTSKEAQDAFDMDIKSGVCKMCVTFLEPFVFEVMGSGFDKQPNQAFYTLRFPRVLKVHWDRTWKDAVGFDELQAMADKASLFESQDAASNAAAWVERLEQVSRGTKGLAVPWDNSQEERDEELPSMIRMDTEEMMPTEQRSIAGSILGTSISQHSTVSNQSECSLPTPPSSFPLRTTEDQNKIGQKQTVLATNSPVTSRKRSVRLEKDEIGKRVAKRAKLHSLDPPSKNRRNFFPYSSSSVQVEPLQIITNDAAWPRKTPPIKPVKSGNLSTLSLVRKMATGTSGRGSTRSKHVIHTSSPSRETTSSECSTDEPSQSTQQSFTSAPSAPIETQTPSQVGDPVSVVSKFDLPTNPDTPEVTEKITIEIPDLKKSIFIVGPCVANLSSLEDILQSSATHVLPFPTAESIVSFPKDAPTRDTILLFDSGGKGDTADVMKQLVTLMPRDSRAAIAIWDWQVMGYLQRGLDADGAGKDMNVRSCFYGRMEWLDEGQLSVRWSDGGETRGASGPRPVQGAEGSS